MRSNKKKKGSILVFVLALIVFISVLSIRLMKETTQELRHVSQFHKRDDLRTYSYSAMDVAACVINEFIMALEKLENGQAWQDALEFAEMETPKILAVSNGNENSANALKWNVEFIDETGKIPFQKVKDKNLEALFAALVNEEEGGGIFDEDDGRPFLDCLRDWEDKDDEERDEGAEDDFYEDLEPKYFTPGRRVSSFDEFGMIRGFGFSINDESEPGLFFNEDGTDTISFTKFKESFSFITKMAINPYTCSELVLRTLAGSDEALFEELRELRSSDSQRDRDDFYNKVKGLASEMGLEITRSINVIRAIVTVERGKSMFQLHAVFSTKMSGGTSQNSQQRSSQKKAKRSERNEKLAYPLRVLALRENENLID
jgi:hypothetical protein